MTVPSSTGECTMRVRAQVSAVLARHGLLADGETLVLGVSGGPDSLCMLHLLRDLAGARGVMLHVGHLHHGLRGADADADAAFVENLCREWAVPCTVERADVPALARLRGLAIEEAARQARYAFLARLAHRVGADTVAVAHNADDQVETILMHLLRGSGLAGLRGMLPVTRLDALRLGKEGREPAVRAGLRLARPLLDVPRVDIEAYCREQGLTPRFDRSNLDQTYYRNRLRHELLPLLETYNPDVREVLRRTAQVLAADYEVLREHLEETWQAVVRTASADAVVYDLKALRAQPLGMQRSLLREGVQRLRRSLRNISLVHIDDALRVVRHGTTGAAATLPQGLLLRLGYNDALLAACDHRAAERLGPCIGAEPLPLSVPGSVELPGGHWRVTAHLCAPDTLPADWRANRDVLRACLNAGKVGAPLALRGRRSGDWMRPLGLGGRQTLHALMVNAKIPRAERDGVPLLVCGDDILWVAGYRLDERYAVTETTAQVLVVQIEPVAGTHGRAIRCP